MRNYYLLLGLFLGLIPASLRAQWEKIPTPYYYSAATQLQAFEGQLFCHTSEGVYRSKNGGQHWELMIQGLCCNGYLHFLNINPVTKSFYFINEEDGQIQISQDRGNTWQTYGQMPVLTPFFERNRGLFFYGDKVYAYQQNYLAIRDNAGALNGWRPLLNLAITPDSIGIIYNVIQNNTHLWVESNFGVFHSSNLGQSWAKPLGNIFRRLVSKGDTLLAYTPGNDTLPPLLSVNNGGSWQPTQAPAGLNRVMSTGGKFYAMAIDTASSYSLFVTTDGRNWSPFSENMFVNSVLEVGKDLFLTIWDYGAPGNLVKTSDGGATFQFSNYGLPRNNQAVPTARFADQYLHLSDGYGISDNEGDSWYLNWKGYALGPVNLFRAGNKYWGWDTDVSQGLAVMQTCPANGRFEWTPSTDLLLDRITSVGAQVYGVVNYTELYKAAADGKSWSKVGTVPASNYLLGIRNKLYSTDSSKIVFSEDEGQSWQTALDFGSLLNINVSRFYRIGDTLVFSYIVNRRIYYLKDDGVSLDTIPVPYEPASNVFRLRVFGRTMALHLGNDENVYLSNNQGQSWIKVPMPAGVTVSSAINTLTANSRVLIVPANNGYLWRLRYDGLRNLRGRVYYDTNVNGQQDAGERGIPDRLIRASNSGFTIPSDANGNFSIALQSAADTLRIPDFSPAFLLNPNRIVVNASDTAFIRWAIQPKRQVADGQVQLVVPAPFRAGFGAPIALTVINQGTLDIAPQLRLRLDPLLSYEASDLPLLQQTGDSLVWQLPTIKPFERFAVHLTLKTAIALPNTPVALALKAVVAQEQTPADNEVAYKGLTVASYDPNDKTVSPQVLPPFETGRKELTYTIRFQNLGNIATDFVTILDTLPDKIDPAQLRILGSSHPMRWRLLQGRVLEFTFNPLRLPPAVQDEPGSHGFVQFTAVVRPGLKAGESIRNKAYIYFDFNPAIITNTAVTDAKTVSVRHPAAVLRALSCFPNPAHTRVTLRCDAVEAGLLQVFDAAGRSCCSAPVAGSEYLLSVDKWAPGIYQVYWQAGETLYAGQLIVE